MPQVERMPATVSGESLPAIHYETVRQDLRVRRQRSKLGGADLSSRAKGGILVDVASAVAVQVTRRKPKTIYIATLPGQKQTGIGIPVPCFTSPNQPVGPTGRIPASGSLPMNSRPV